MLASEPGIIAMSITPFTGDGALDVERLRTHVRFLRDGGVGVCVASQGSGEGDLLSFDEKVEVYATAAAESGAAVPVIAAGIGLAGRTETMVALAVAADRAGCTAVQLLGPRPGAVPPQPLEIERYFRALIESVRCDVCLSSNPMLMGYGLAPELVDELLADYAHVRALHVTDRDPATLRAWVERFADRATVRIGITAEASACRALGARGLLSFEANVAPQLVADAWASGDFSRVMQLNSVLARGGNPRSLKAALTDAGPLREPYLALTAEECATLKRELDRLFS
jgi:dihydrodipicolinate synthase/N-acetylneuraminate lyase